MVVKRFSNFMFTTVFSFFAVSQAFAVGADSWSKISIELADGSFPSVGVDRKGIQQTIICRPNKYSEGPILLAKIIEDFGFGGKQIHQVAKNLTMPLCLALRQEAIRQLVVKEQKMEKTFFQDWFANKNTPVSAVVTFDVFSSGNLAYDGEIESILIGNRLIFNQLHK